MKATYHTDSGTREQRLDVLSKNEDGSVELGHKGAGEDGKDVLVIGKCKVSAQPEIGQCVLDAEAPAPAPEDPDKKKSEKSKK